MYRPLGEPRGSVRFSPGRRADPVSGRIPTVIAHGAPLTDYIGREYHGGGPGRPGQRFILPRAVFDDRDELRRYLSEVEADCRRALDAAPALTDHGGVDFTVLRDLVWHLDRAEDMLEQFGRQPGVTIGQVGVLGLERPAVPPFLAPQGQNTLAVIPGAAYWVRLLVDCGEELAPLFPGSTVKTALVRTFDVRMSVSRAGAALRIQCLLVDDGADEAFATHRDRAELEGAGYYPPLYDPASVGYDDLMRGLGEGTAADVERVTGLEADWSKRIVGLDVNADLRTVSLLVAFDMSGFVFDPDGFEDFIVEVLRIAVWSQNPPPPVLP